MTRYKNNAMKEARMDCQVKQLEKENTGLRNHVFSLQGEVYGARLAAKYLDKELAGRFVIRAQNGSSLAMNRTASVLLSCTVEAERLPRGHSHVVLRQLYMYCVI